MSKIVGIRVYFFGDVNYQVTTVVMETVQVALSQLKKVNAFN